MSILVFPDQHSNPSLETFSLRRTDDPQSDLRLSVRNLHPIHKGRSSVYRATLEGDVEPQEVACKVVYGKRSIAKLHNEVEIYQHLHDLQGGVIPYCLGLFQGEMEDGQAGCLITKYCGKPVDVELAFMNWTFKMETIKALSAIHAKGVKHNDFSERNILVGKDRRPIIIDFDCAQKEECKVTDDVHFHTEEPLPEVFGCQELFSAAKLADAWTPRVIPFLRGYSPVKYAESVETLMSAAPDVVPRDVARFHAEYAMERYKKALSKREACEPYEL
ncbi:hypothetical protein BKA93DRAFT_809120 [Sparassis latifolia]|uniref:Protein kinase domain-containing protein n=1 Tax=Sparassis crispa TaxID=139825 RepID=A0A401H5Q1_9APHY|nr:hypothetical protein SCP_1700370 [Sparassis crispa]GBE89713.1 hypothetical protein SCP_1700370 [Sparassis crispa]